MSAEFLSLAAQCFQFADNAGNAEYRASLLKMAQAWLDLAAEEEQITKLVREADTAFEIRASDVAQGAPLWAMDLAQSSSRRSKDP
jgi:hypothetical protein